jgi:Cap4 dsDNA endonuclease
MAKSFCRASKNMPTTGPPSPEQISAQNDPGDETARRYRYQYTWAAIVCCMLFDETQDIEEVFCEHHEDVLLKHSDGTFTGHQVKTRESGQPLWKTSDAQVKRACARFAQLEANFSGQFRGYRFLTSHPLHSTNNSQALPYVLQEIANGANITELPSSVCAWLRLVAREAGGSEAVAFAALKKATASADLPKLADSFMRLIDMLTDCWSDARNCSHDSVRRAAQALVDECARAASLNHELLLPAYMAAVEQPVAEVRARIEGKRMTLSRVQAILSQGLDSTASLAGGSSKLVEPGQGSTDLMLRKLDAGGFSAVSRNSAEDLRDSADYLALVWTKKFGRAKGLERYNHILSSTLNDASRAFETTKTEGSHFGPAMREALRRRFRERRLNCDQLFDCSDDHLEGVAYSLTAQCKVQWSNNRPWEVT